MAEWPSTEGDILDNNNEHVKPRRSSCKVNVKERKSCGYNIIWRNDINIVIISSCNSFKYNFKIKWERGNNCHWLIKGQFKTLIMMEKKQRRNYVSDRDQEGHGSRAQRWSFDIFSPKTELLKIQINIFFIEQHLFLKHFTFQGPLIHRIMFCKNKLGLIVSLSNPWSTI